MNSTKNPSLLLLLLFGVMAFGFAQNLKTNTLIQPEKTDRTLIPYQDNLRAPLTKRELQMVTEVFGGETKSMVLDDAAYLNDIKNLLRNRISIQEVTEPSKQKKTKLLSQIPLNKTYNSNLTRDNNFDKGSFNPLKYQLDFFENGTYLYKVDNTNYFIQVTSQYRIK